MHRLARFALTALPLLATSCPASNSSVADLRKACGYAAGTLAAVTLVDQSPLGNQPFSSIPLDHIVLVMQENRTFDHYFSSLSVPGQSVDGASPLDSNPDPLHPGGTITRFHLSDYCFDDPAESWDQVHREVNGGALDGFTSENALSDSSDPSGQRALGYYDESDLPYYYALARAFSISDRHFSSVLGPTWPNRLFYFAGTSFGVTKSQVFPPQFDAAGNLLPNLFTRLNDAKVSWRVYDQDIATVAMLNVTWQQNFAHFAPYSQFFVDAAAGTLASVSVVEGSDLLGGASPDEDPPADIQIGQAMVAHIVQAVTSSPLWPKSALFLSYDEQGGLYDHVVPPTACVPDDYEAQVDPGGVAAPFDQLGLRVPLIVVSPYAKRGYVSHQVTDHTSLLRFIEARFGLPALTRRDANALPPFDMFDFSHANLELPPLPEATIDPIKAAACAAKYPPG